MVGHMATRGKISAVSGGPAAASAAASALLLASALSLSLSACARAAEPAHAPEPTQGADASQTQRDRAADSADAAHARTAAGDAGDAGDDGPQVRATLLADAEAVAPGQSMTLAVRFDIAPGWHIYWSNPGDAGLATEVEFTAPDGAELGAIRYPGPVRFTSPGPVVSYGYAGSVMLSAPVTLPANLAPSSEARFVADAFWLACRDVCVRGGDELTLALPVRAEPPPASSSAAFAAHERALPKPLEDAPGARHRWQRTGEGAVLVLTLDAARDPAEMAFFPGPEDQLAVTRAEAVPGAVDSGEGAQMRVEYRAPGAGAKAPGPARARGVLRVGSGFYQVDVPGPAAR